LKTDPDLFMGLACCRGARGLVRLNGPADRAPEHSVIPVLHQQHLPVDHRQHGHRRQHEQLVSDSFAQTGDVGSYWHSPIVTGAPEPPWSST
jgi:hypothetical protein